MKTQRYLEVRLLLSILALIIFICASGLVNGFQSIVPNSAQSSKTAEIINGTKHDIETKLQTKTLDDLLRLEVMLDKPIKSSVLFGLISSYQKNVERYIYKYNDITAWYAPKDNETLQESFNRFEKFHKKMLERRLKYLADTSLLSSVADDEINFLKLQTSQQKQFLVFTEQLEYFNNNGMVFSGFVLKGSVKEVLKLLKEIPLVEAEYRGVLANENFLEGGFLKCKPGKEKPPYPNNPWKFSPTNGVIEYIAEQKLFSSTFFWKDTSGFTSIHSAYEHNISIYNDKDTYVRASGENIFTNLPGAYLDSPLFDDFSDFTIGSEQAQEIRPFQQYFVEIGVEVINPNAGPSQGDVQPQLGSYAGKYNDGCPPGELLEKDFCEKAFFITKFCIFADQTYGKLRYFNELGYSVDFRFDHSVSRTYQWDKDYNPSQFQCGNNKFRAEYSNVTNNPNNEVALIRCDGYPIDFDFGAGGPGIVNNDEFKVRWAGNFSFEQGDYTFIARADDGIKVFVDGEIIIDEFREQAETEFRKTRTMSAGLHFIEVQYFEKAGNAVAKFRWEKQVINLFPRIDRITPSQVTVGNENERLIVEGKDFSSNFKAVVRNSRGEAFPLTGTQIKYISSSKVEVLVTIGKPGDLGDDLTIEICNLDDNKCSDPFPFIAKPLRITNVILQATPRPNEEFSAIIEGEGFETNNIQLPVTGIGCSNDPKNTPCIVPRSVLEGVTATRIDRARFTLNNTGDFLVYVQNGNGGPISNGFRVTVTPTPIDFSISATPSTQSVIAGNSITYSVTTTTNLGPPQTVKLSVDTLLPTGVSAFFDRNTISPGEVSTLTIMTSSSTPVSNYTLSLNAAINNNSIVRSTNVSFNVTAPSDFSISVNPELRAITSGDTAQYTIITNTTTGNPQNLNLSTGNLPPGVTSSFSARSITSGNPSVLTLTTTASTPASSSTITIFANGSTASKTATISLTVNVPVNDFSINVDPLSRTVTAGNQAQYTIFTTTSGSNSQTINLSAPDLPPGASAMFSSPSITSGNSSTLTVTTSSSTPVGSHTFTIKGVGSTTKTITATLNVLAPNTFSALP